MESLRTSHDTSRCGKISLQRLGPYQYARIISHRCSTLTHSYHIFSSSSFGITEEWREDLVPLNEIGKIELTQNPTNYFAEVEQAAFSPGNLIDGWEPSDDPVLQMRLFAYTDAQVSLEQHLHIS
jgi:hypothetical protein